MTRIAEPDSLAGPDGNERLTASAGALLLVLFAIQGFTILSLGGLLTVHFFVGLMLTGPVALKLGATGYRFTRYYTGAPAYRRKGPPYILLRLLGPFVVLTSVTVLTTGVLLAVLGRGKASHEVLFLHKASFYLWLAAVGVHVLAYVWRLPRLVGADLRRPARHAVAVPGAAYRWALLAGSLGAGAAVAFWGVHLASAWRR